MKNLLKLFKILFIVSLILFGLPLMERTADAGLIDEYLYEIAEKHYENGNYDEALREFEKIVILNPGNKNAKEYIRIINAIMQGDTTAVIGEKTKKFISQEIEKQFKAREEKYEKALDKSLAGRKNSLKRQIKEEIQQEMSRYPLKGAEEPLPEYAREKTTAGKIEPKPQKTAASARQEIEQEAFYAEKDTAVSDVLDQYSLISARPKQKKIERMEEEIITIKKQAQETAKADTKPAKPRQKDYTRKTISKPKILYLTSELQQALPQTVEIQLDKTLIIEGDIISRHLIEKSDLLIVSKIDRDRISITGKNIGSSIIHIWDAKGRWTFTVRIVPLYIPPPEEDIRVVEESPFRIRYSADWQTYNKGDSIKDIERQTLSFNQWAGIEGPTPYGYTDASLRLSKFEKEHDITNYTLGLTDGKIGSFKNFSLRAFDFDENFSELSYPGELLRGATGTFDAFSQNIQYTAFWGKERESVFGFSVPGVLEEKNSVVEGARVTLFPYKNKHYSFNFAKGYGADRPEHLKDEVYSFEGGWNLENKDLDWEIAYDGECFAGFVSTNFKISDWLLQAKLRDIDNAFTTINGNPPDRGEIGGILGLRWNPKGNLSAHTQLDVYRTKYNFNEGRPNALNFDWDSDLTLSIGENSSLDTAISYINEPGLAFPRRYASLSSTYSTLINLMNRKIYPFAGFSFARSRNTLSTASDYDTYKGTGGIRLALAKNLYYRISYEYNWLKEKGSGENSNPTLLETSLDYDLNISPSLSLNTRLLFRDETDADLPHSFLAGEDNIEGSIRANYNPSEDIEFFAEARLRKFWAEISTQETFADADLLWGLRCSWDTFFKWNPKGKISGFVFKDLNGDGLLDDNEPMLKDVKIAVGNKTIKTNHAGYFSTPIRGKKVTVKIIQDTLPEGYILSTPSSFEVDITKDRAWINFGASVFSTIYGVVFHDINSNGKFDRREDIPLPGVKLLLDNKTAFTNLEGSYYYRQLEKGDHMLRLDLESVPVDYIPTIPLTKTISLSEGANYIYSFPMQVK
ncbi:MAG: hypothetical protein COV72_00270 [Candidatus Omnitrophica bacterium CG11_big_fil_rev_8_21_14_0_20_42_13]|uniref:Uncharacterized protein n=1 Tax=Candidatus Ghiorseimicrobium undicola TaxID=1974746 RepID=A0A2H0M008_9BACT|nr:MAG: hypothetical protein COV72_00270 [Candidatus Omnitrophica bacterium CG11_big_fil_rev_8_21_14_0_20_42_13]